MENRQIPEIGEDFVLEVGGVKTMYRLVEITVNDGYQNPERYFPGRGWRCPPYRSLKDSKAVMKSFVSEFQKYDEKGEIFFSGKDFWTFITVSGVLGSGGFADIPRYLVLSGNNESGWVASTKKLDGKSHRWLVERPRWPRWGVIPLNYKPL